MGSTRYVDCQSTMTITPTLVQNFWRLRDLTAIFENEFPVGEKCKESLRLISAGMQNGEAWSYNFLDSSTKVPNGILTGNLIDLGNYDECLGIRIPSTGIRGQHCLASIPLTNATRSDDSLGVLPSLLWSYCIPSTCTAEDLQSALNGTIFPVSGLAATVSPGDCHVQQPEILDASVIFGLSFIAAFLVICLASTAYDLWPSRSQKGILASFSFVANTQRLLDVSSSADTMKPLNGIRFLSIAWVVLGHRYFFTTTSPSMNAIHLQDFVKRVDFQIVASGELSVDTFFLLSGLLNAYYLFKIMDATRKFPVFTYFFHRYIRTTPALAVVILIYATWFVRIGDGPLWNRSVQPWTDFCQQNWWVNLLYINNYYHPVAQCAGQSWYLAVDFQLYCLAPLVILPCWKWPKITKVYLGLLLALSVASPFTVSYIEGFRMPFTISQDIGLYQRLTQYLMVPTHTRATPYIVGIMLGLFLHHVRKSQSKLTMGRAVVIIGWLLSATVCLSALLGNYPLMQPEADHPYNRLESSFYIGFFRLGWGAGISWVIVACLFGYGGLVNSFLSWNGFVPLSRLTYSIFLTHMSIQQYQTGVLRTAGYISDFNQVHEYLGDLVMSLFLAAALCLMFESPIMVIEKHLRKPRVLKGDQNEGYVKDDSEKKP